VTFRQIRLSPALAGVALLATACGPPQPPDRQTMIAQDWTCEMISEADGLKSLFVETVSLRPAGDYQSKATVTATNLATSATMQLEWTGRWALSGDTLRRTFSGLKAGSGEANGVALTQDLLDKAASEFRRAPVGAEGRLVSLSEREMTIATNFDPITCRR
jgi:cellulase/cellobiase CelA1